jgi:hypothetical protein
MVELFGSTLAIAVIAALMLTNLLTLVLLFGGASRLSGLPDRERYRELHPQSIDHLGNLRCWKCSSTVINVDWKAFDKGVNVHSCAHCGTRLYRS